MKPWQRNPPPIIAPRRNPDTIPAAPAAPLDAPALRVEHAAPLAPAAADDLTLAQRVAGLEQKAFYDGQYIAQLRAELTTAGQCIDALACRLGALGDRVNQLSNSGAGISQPGADNPPGV